MKQNKILAIMMLIVIIGIIVVPLAIGSISAIKESKREYYCPNGGNLTLDDKICTLVEKKEVESFCNDNSYNHVGTRCKLKDTIYATTRNECDEGFRDMNNGNCVNDSGMAKAVKRYYDCPSGYTNSKVDTKVCVREEDVYKEIDVPQTPSCEEGYELQLQNLYIEEDGTIVQIPEHQIAEEKREYKCVKSIEYEASWK